MNHQQTIYHFDMKDLLYIPFSSLNFNSIFSTENISPHSFYTKRSFGYKRNKQSTYQPNDNCLLLFNKLFNYQISNSDYEEYPMFIAVSEAVVAPFIKKKISAENIEISIIDSTIYFDTNNFFFIFPDKAIQQTVISKSLSSFETKTVSKYLSCFKTINEFQNEIQELNLPEIAFEFKGEIEIQKDETFDSLKGFFYCLLLGYLFNKPKVLLDIEIAATQIQNEFGGFKSEIELSGSKANTSYSKDWKKGKYSNNDLSSDKYKSILSQIDFLKAKIIEAFGKKNEDDFIKEFVSSLNRDYEMLRTFFVIDGLREFVFKEAQQYNPTPEYLANELSDIVSSYFNNKENSYQKEKLDNDFKDLLNKLNLILQKKFQPSIDEDKIELLKSLGGQLDDRFEFYNFFATQKISEDDFKLFQIICKVLLKNRKRHKGETEIEIKNKILEQVGKVVNQEFGEKSVERNYLFEFHKLLNNKSHNFQIQNSKHNSLQSFVSLLINIDSAERLEEFIIANNLNHRFIALSMFGLFNGFSGLGKTLTNKIFDSKNFRLLNAIDSVLLKRTLEVIPETYPILTVNEPTVEYLKEFKSEKKTNKEKKAATPNQKKSEANKSKKDKPTEQSGQIEMNYNNADKQ